MEASYYILPQVHAYYGVSWLRSDAVQCSKLGNGNFDAGHTRCCRGPQDPHPCTKSWV